MKKAFVAKWFGGIWIKGCWDGILSWHTKKGFVADCNLVRKLQYWINMIFWKAIPWYESYVKPLVTTACPVAVNTWDVRAGMLLYSPHDKNFAIGFFSNHFCKYAMPNDD